MGRSHVCFCFLSQINTSALLSRFRYYLQNVNQNYVALGPIVALNLLVFCLWRVPRLSSVMQRYFLCCPRSSSVTSIFVLFLLINSRASSAPFHIWKHGILPLIWSACCPSRPSFVISWGRIILCSSTCLPASSRRTALGSGDVFDYDPPFPLWEPQELFMQLQRSLP